MKNLILVLRISPSDDSYEVIYERVPIISDVSGLAYVPEPATLLLFSLYHRPEKNARQLF
jgi:hypothetical protein